MRIKTTPNQERYAAKHHLYYLDHASSGPPLEPHAVATASSTNGGSRHRNCAHHWFT